jgi:hypothetical protein
MASIALSIIGCIDYLAYGTIFTRAMFRPKKKLDVFFPARKAGDEPRRVVSFRRGSLRRIGERFMEGKRLTLVGIFWGCWGQ